MILGLLHDQYVQCTLDNNCFDFRECALPESLGRQLLALFCPGDEKIIEDCNEQVCIHSTVDSCTSRLLFGPIRYEISVTNHE